MATRLQTPSGRLEGEDRHGVYAFKGIPYAAPPVGKLRLRPPEGPRAWDGTRPARRFGPSAPQLAPVAPFLRRLIGVGSAGQDEDCLTLNVWTPGLTGRPRPVMVWIHGGAFVLGSGSTGLYNGSRLARRGDCVVVSLNYRLGALGFLDLDGMVPGSDGARANLGLLDQIAALEWVRDHIPAFGGDPERVTIFGESAGAMSVGALLGAPPARGLFHRAILQSGAAHNVSTPERAREVTEHFLAQLSLSRPSLDALAQVPLQELLEAQSRTSSDLGMVDGQLPWQPSVDGVLLPRTPLEAIAHGLNDDVPVLIGSNQEEWKLFMLADRVGHRLDELGLRRRLDRTLRLHEPDDALRPALSEAAYDHYRELGAPRASSTPRDRWVAFQSDRVFHVPAFRLARARAERGAPTWSYLFDWAPPLLRGRVGSCHGLEIPFVFGTLRDPWLRTTIGATRSARRLSHRMQRAWIEFARSGRPGQESLPDWPAVSAQRMPTLRLGARNEVRDGLFESEHGFWERVL